MAFTSYLLSKFENTHENVFFREFSADLDKAFKNEAGESVLLGNVSCNGHQIDAIFIRTGQITILDFKDYSGTLTFAENNPWKLLDTSDKLVFVQGGSQCRNPFQQVKAYRFTIADFLSARAPEIIVGVNNNVDWYHTGCIVLFHRNVEFDNSTLPQNINRWFRISDKQKIVNDLSDRNSQKLAFTDNEIRNMLRVFNVMENNRLDRIHIEEPVNVRNVNPGKLALLRRLLSNDIPVSEYKKLIKYYKTLINLERYKEPESSETIRLALDPAQLLETYPINLSVNEVFHEKWLRNLTERFPKNLFIALNLKIDNTEYPMLHTILLATDLTNRDVVDVDLNTLDMYTKTLERLELSEDIIEEITNEVGKCDKLEEKISAISNVLGYEVTIGSSLEVGLSTESLYTSQLLSELGKLDGVREVGIGNSLFKNFLFNRELETTDPYNIHPMIQITDMNRSQRDSVLKSFTQPLTVITGPPGTGKSQVVLNILANAIASSNSVLFASKNNKAVDTVKERFDSIIGANYLIRFGSKEEIENNAKPALKEIIQRWNNGGYAVNEADYITIQNLVNTKRSRINAIEAILDSIPVKTDELNLARARKSKLETEHNTWKSALDPITANLFVDLGLRVAADSVSLSYTINKIDKWNSGWFNRLIFRLFSEKELVDNIRQIDSREVKQINIHLNETAPWAIAGESVLISSKRHLEYLIELKKKETEFYKYLEKYSTTKNDLDSKIQNLERELEGLNHEKPILEKELAELLRGQASLGVDYLRMTIKKKLSNLNTSNLQSFIDFLPANNVWRNEDVISFTNKTKRFLRDFNAVCVTNLSVKNNLPFTDLMFDLLVIDEASQCDIASALPLIYRAKKVTIIGDPLQLKHITSVQDYEEDYLIERLGLQSFQLKYHEKSLYDYGFGLTNKSKLESIFLNEHYRSHSEIIGFSNDHFYERRLGQSMIIKTNDADFQYGKKGINWININGAMDEERNINEAEVAKCIEIASSLKNRFPSASIGIVTPFRDQYRALFENIPPALRNEVKVDTVHKYQGDEKDIIIFSTVVAFGSLPGKSVFINRNDYLINVAITRARSALYIVGDHDYCLNLSNDHYRTPLSALAMYVKRLNKVG